MTASCSGLAWRQGGREAEARAGGKRGRVEPCKDRQIIRLPRCSDVMGDREGPAKAW